MFVIFNLRQILIDLHEPKAKKGRTASSGSQFGMPLSEAQVRQGPVVPNTVKNTQWALRVFLQHLVSTEDGRESEKCLENLLENKPSDKILNNKIY